jgi:hypothetical protein
LTLSIWLLLAVVAVVPTFMLAVAVLEDWLREPSHLQHPLRTQSQLEPVVVPRQVVLIAFFTRRLLLVGVQEALNQTVRLVVLGVVLVM